MPRTVRAVAIAHVLIHDGAAPMSAIVLAIILAQAVVCMVPTPIHTMN